MISDGGRDQFSELKEKIVRNRNAEFARRAHGLAQSLDAAAMTFDARQAARGRPAPIAIHDDGDVPRHSRSRRLRAAACVPNLSALPRRSNRHDLLFLAGEQLLDLGDGRVGRFLHLAGLPLLFVFADLVLLLELLEKIEAVAADMTHRDARRFGIFVRDLDDFACAAPR